MDLMERIFELINLRSQVIDFLGNVFVCLFQLDRLEEKKRESNDVLRQMNVNKRLETLVDTVQLSNGDLSMLLPTGLSVSDGVHRSWPVSSRALVVSRRVS